MSSIHVPGFKESEEIEEQAIEDFKKLNPSLHENELARVSFIKGVLSSKLALALMDKEVLAEKIADIRAILLKRRHAFDIQEWLELEKLMGS